MKELDQIKALAELDRFECIDISPPLRYLKPDGSPAFSYLLGDTGWFWTKDTPNYLHSYDAIIPLAIKMGLQITIDKNTTPAEVAEIVLRATGKWTE